MVYFQTKKIALWVNFRGPWLLWKMSVYFMAVRSILLPFRIFYGHLVYFHRFGCVVPRKIWQPSQQHAHAFGKLYHPRYYFTQQQGDQIWSNFCHLGDCLPIEFFYKVTKWPNFWDTFLTEKDQY
jgi:hypothetical protein